MTNRKKRLKKGIESIEEELKVHREKKEQAREEGNIELEGYYEKEIRGLEEEKEKKKEALRKEEG